MNKSELLSVAKPILFNTLMVQAILDDRKTATRRAMKPQPLFKTTRKFVFNDDECPKQWEDCDNIINTYRYQVGDILYVRETWHKYTKRIGKGASCRLEQFYGYKASIANSEDSKEKWRPSIHMPKEAARIFLRVTDVRLERLQDMIPNDFKREGIIKECDGCPHFHDLCGGMVRLAADCKIDRTINYSAVFAELWDSTVDKKHRGFYGWNGNPWVWVIEFERLEVSE